MTKIQVFNAKKERLNIQIVGFEKKIIKSIMKMLFVDFEFLSLSLSLSF